MARLNIGRRSLGLVSNIHQLSSFARFAVSKQSQRLLQTKATPQQRIPDFAFAFDIDGVLLRSSKALPRAQKALAYLQTHRIPFILLTNGGGKLENDRVVDLTGQLGVPLDPTMFIQSHTPFTELVNGKESLKENCILVCGGEGDRCRQVAENYGFTNVLTPSDLITAFPTIWPFASQQYHSPHARPLPGRSLSPRDLQLSPDPKTIKIDAIFIFHDPRDWALDTQIILDLLFSSGGYLGSFSPKNNNPSLPNRGYLQDGQPPLYFSNPDLFWAAAYPLPRLGQGGFRGAFQGVWNAATGGSGRVVQLKSHMFGKPTQGTFEFAEKRLQAHRKTLLGSGAGLKNVYMVGDNPESDIRGANEYRSPSGSTWHSILVRSGVYNSGDEPAHTPKTIVDDVWDAVQWGMGRKM